MELRALEYFVAVADAGGFSRAARLLGVAQPALSRQVRALEVELRQNLLLRNGRGAETTEAGRRLLAHARGILHQVERARRELDDVKDEPVGHVVIGLPPSFARVLSAPIVRDFRQRFPRASVAIVEGLSTSIHEGVVLGRVDVGMLYNPVPSPAIDLQPLFDEDLCLIVPRGTARAGATTRLRDLPGYPLIIPSRLHAIRTLVEARLAGLGLKPQVALEVDAIGAILELVAEGHGFAVLSPRALQIAEAGRRLVARPIVQPRLRIALALAVSSQRPATPLQAACVDLVAGLAAKGRSGAPR